MIELLERLGVRFSVDIEGDVSIEYPDTVTADGFRRAVEAEPTQLDELFLEVRRRKMKSRRRVFVGGPFAGQKCLHASRRVGTAFGVKVRYALWAVYEVGNDKRAIFLGYAKSAEKASKRVMDGVP